MEKITEELDNKNQTRGEALKKAIEIINGERQNQYGNPEDSFQIIANYWTAYLYAEGLIAEYNAVSPKDAAIMMVLFKIARMSGQKDKPDNYADAAGYIGIAGDMVKK